VALQDSSLSSGEGDDWVNLNAWAQGSTTLAIAAENSTIDTGSGNDRLSLNASTSDVANLDPAFGAVDTDLLLGDGEDNLTILSSAEGGNGSVVEATGLALTYLAAGSGDDSADITAWARGESAHVWGAATSVIDLGDSELSNVTLDLNPGSSWVESGWSQDDSLLISVWANGTTEAKAVALLKTQVYSGAGNNNVALSATAASNWAAGTLVQQAEAVALSGSLLSTGEGNDRVSVQASASGATTLAIGALDSSIDTGSGNDDLQLSATTNDNLYLDPAIGAQSSTLTLGSGDDSASIIANAEGSGTMEATGLLTTTLSLNDGADQVTIAAHAFSRDGEAKAVALDGSIVIAGDGNDSITLVASQNGIAEFDQPAIALRQSVVDLGTGDDLIALTGGSVQSTIQGGSGRDVIVLNGVKLADVTFTRLASGSAYDVNYVLGGSTYQLRLDSVESIQADDGGSSLELNTESAESSMLLSVSDQSPGSSSKKAKRAKKAKTKRSKKVK